MVSLMKVVSIHDEVLGVWVEEETVKVASTQVSMTGSLLDV